MNKISTKLLSVLAIILFIAIIPVVVFATESDISVVSSKDSTGNQEYIIYVKDYTDKTFKYALSNNANPEVMDLVYINSITDLGENQVAYLDAKTYNKLSGSAIYMWAKDNEENLILNGIEIDFEKSLTKESIDLVESITKRINVEIADNQESTETIRNENINGVQETSAVGYVKITDNENAKYYYERIKIADSEQAKTLMELTEKISKEYDEMNMYDKVVLAQQFNSIYSNMIEKAKWQEVKNMLVEQPEESVAGDKYIVLLKKVEENNEESIERSIETNQSIITDAQFLTSFDDYKPNVVKEQKITQETAKLPITYDSIALIIVLAIVVVAAVVVYIRMKKVSNQNEEQK